MNDIDRILATSRPPHGARGTGPLRIGIAGPCGVGKSTLTAAFGKLPGVGVVGEPVFSDLIETLPVSGSDTGALLQERILRGRAEAATRVKESLVVFDRTLAEDRHVFFPLHRQLGTLSKNDELRLTSMGEVLERASGVPVAMVILTASIDTLQRRARADGRPGWLVESLPLQLELYEIWLDTLEVPFLAVNTDHVSRDAFPALAEWIVTTVPQALAGVGATRSEHGVSWSRLPRTAV